MPLAPEYEAMFAELAKEPGPALSDLPPEGGREMYRMMRPVVAELPIGQIENRTIPGPDGDINLRIYQPSSGGENPVVVFFHGGGWVIGDLDTADAACRDLAEALPCTVVSVDYRLAPEHPFPAAPDDCYAATVWCAENQAQLSGNGQIVVAGESAGGNLAAVTALRARDGSGPQIAGQLLLYPVVDADLTRDSYSRNGEGYLLTTDSMRWFWAHYCADEPQRRNPDASPLLAQSHASLPPAIVVTAEFDPLCDEGAAYAAAMQAAGSDASHLSFDGMVHDFFATAPMFASSRQAVDQVYGSLRDLLGRS